MISRSILEFCRYSHGGSPIDQDDALLFWTGVYERAKRVHEGLCVYLEQIGAEPVAADLIGADPMDIDALIREIATRYSIVRKVGPAARVRQLQLVLGYIEWAMSLSIVAVER